MAQELDDGKFWLPSEFLTDEELLMDFKIESDGSGNSSCFNSDLSSPVESIMGSTETESDEDEFVTGFTRKLAGFTQEHSCFSCACKSTGRKLSGSPQSTLCMCRPGSSRGSPYSVSQVSSPPKTSSRHSIGIELLYAAAEQVAKIRLIEELYAHKPFAPSPKPGPVTNPYGKPGFYRDHISHSAHYRQMRENQYRFQNSGLSAGAWPTLRLSQQQQKPGSGMRAIFLGEAGIKKERTGTGVFLPRRIEIGANKSYPTETREKPAVCSVLLPDRVVHALNLNLDSTESHQRKNLLMSQQQWGNLKPQQPLVTNNQGLPQEWTY